MRLTRLGIKARPTYGSERSWKEEQGDDRDDTHVGAVAASQQGHLFRIFRDRFHRSTVAQARLGDLFGGVPDLNIQTVVALANQAVYLRVALSHLVEFPDAPQDLLSALALVSAAGVRCGVLEHLQ